MKYQARKAKIVSTGKFIYAAMSNDLSIDERCWFSHPDGNNYDCSFVMNNREFKKLLSKGEIEMCNVIEYETQNA